MGARASMGRALLIFRRVRATFHRRLPCGRTHMHWLRLKYEVRRPAGDLFDLVPHQRPTWYGAAKSASAARTRDKGAFYVIGILCIT